MEYSGNDNAPEIPRSSATKTKKVRITSPPRSPPQVSSPPPNNPLVRRLSSGQHNGSPPPPIRTLSPENSGNPQDDPFGKSSEGGESTEDEELIQNTRRNSGSIGPAVTAPAAPTNPFSKTLATTEPSSSQTPQHREAAATSERGTADQIGPGAGKGSMDVDSFKRLLMTGSAGSSASAYSTAVPSVSTHHRSQSGIGGDSSSSTDTSSVSRQSIFEPVQEPQLESPRTSYELSITDDDESSNLMGEGRRPDKKKKPPPPTGKRRHGKLVQQRAPQIVSFSDFSLSVSSPGVQPPSPIDASKPLPPLQRTSSDLNKPLPPPPPAHFNPDVQPPLPEAENVAQIAGPEVTATPPPIEEVPSAQRKKPPTPPLARRQSQRKPLGPDRLSSNPTPTPPPQAQETAPPEALPSTHSTKAPTPPPARRTAAAATSASTTPKPTAPSTTDLPGPSPSYPPTSLARHSSSASASASAKAAPAPPPPRRGSSKSSIDLSRSPEESRRPSAEVLRGSLDGGRRASGASASSLRNEYAPLGAGNGGGVQGVGGAAVEEARKAGAASGSDILAEMEAMQREVEALRERYRRGS
ncbi:hypothetical protein W97_06101 [Coniosporium apollinis CBS 100218]|uniref:Uncharacterized protein n=1 Tax=Coniosporium apollinis (strain CBS 100218) TaxID=1168221 RepID=R7YYG3_CONA1|nr:uncharacterized protein W97_06101 [Coniosporium apollinis CBS 100218]EON66985.1 hypothetical protein W97_06101 [Coniosporium apollinis CBS 100218]